MRPKLFWICCLFASGCSASTSPGTTTQATAFQSAHNPLDASAQQELRSIVDAGRLADLRWQNFSDYSVWVKQFYEQGSTQLAWTSANKPTAQALELISALEAADQKGLDARDYDADRWAARIAALNSSTAPPASDLVKFDVALTVSAMRYISDLHMGRVDPKTIHRDFDPERHKYNLAEFLRQRVMHATSVEDSLQGIEPPFPGYQRSIAALQKYLQLARDEVPDPLPAPAKPIALGQSYDALPKLAARLKFLGDLPPETPIPSDSLVYQGAIVDAVKRFQQRHGLEAAGKLGPQTIDEVNRRLSFRVRQLQLVLERWRWLPHNFDAPPVVVNIPEFILRGYDSQGHQMLRIRVVVGRAMRTETPVMAEDMKYVVFWPYWNVPPSILRNEIVPKITKDPGYIEKNNYEVVTFSGQHVTDGAVSEDVLSQLRAGKLMVRQKPGPKNALGLVKFIFPNSNNVYLHSTPSTSLFSQSRRDFSHGCIRVEDPAALAEWVLRNNPGWTRDKIDAAFKAEKEQQVNLAKTIPVLIVYGTAVVPENGPVEFLPDIYGMDKSLERLITAAYASKN